MNATATLTETSPAMEEALRSGLTAHFGTDVEVGVLHTGGGCMVLRADLSQDGRGMGREIWLTREEDWILGVYDFAGLDAQDYEGICVNLFTTKDNAAQVAATVVGILARFGVNTLA